MDLSILNGRVLLPDGSLADVPLRIVGGRIDSVGGAMPKNGARVWDADGALVLPGIVDLHGDAFERQLLPRPEAPFPVSLALAETDRQLVTNGITTAYHSVTYSWEPGLRGRAQVVELLGAIETLRPRLSCDTRIHLRWEMYNLEAEDEIAGWLESGRVDLLSFNDHSGHILEQIENRSKLERYSQRTGLPAEDFVALLHSVSVCAADVPAAVDRLAAIARKNRIVMASHDDETPETRRRYSRIGCTLCEFPSDAATADTSVELGDSVILGAPNVVRDGSHCGRLDAAESVAAGRCHILTSDYFYPSLLKAVFILVENGLADLPAAWRLVSSAPARAAGLTDRGDIVEGKRADIVAVDDSDPIMPRTTGTFVAGRPAYVTRLGGS